MTDGPQSAIEPVLAEALDWVVKVNENPADPRVLTGLNDWLAVSEAHGRAYRKAERIWRLTGEVAPVHRAQWGAGAPARSSRGVRLSPLRKHAERSASRPRGSRGHGPRKRWIAFLGTTCAASLAALLLLRPGLFDGATYRTGVGEVRDVMLPDDSVVTLGGGSAIRVDYDATRRQVTLLGGEAFFKVVHDGRRPFVVEAGGMTARDVGTAFDIDLEPSVVDIAVQSGAVGVSFGIGAPATLAAGQSLKIDRATGRIMRGEEPVAAIAAWRTGRLIVDNLAVGDVIAQLRRYYRGYIWLRDPVLHDRRISGVYDLNEPVSALKAMVQPHAGVVTEITPLLLVVSSR
jgi:transmembrane sensor